MPNEDLDAFLNRKSAPEPEPAPEPVMTEPAPETAPEPKPEPEPAPEPSEAEPTDRGDARVPVSALQAERAQRQDWKEKALRYEGEMAAIKAQLAQLEAAKAAAPPPTQPPQVRPPPNVVEDPQGYTQWLQDQLFNERLNMSQSMLQRQNLPDMEDALKAWQEAAKNNPVMGQQLRQQPDPYGWVYNEGKRLLMLSEIGNDPAAYRAKIEADAIARARAEWEAGGQSPQLGPAQEQPATPLPNIPGSLATARSAASRSAPAWTGPTPLSAILTK